MSIINIHGRQLKSRELQEKDFRETISQIAEENCTVCGGKGWSTWDERLRSLIPCQCVMINAHLERVKKAKETGKKHIQSIELVKA